MPLLCFSKTFEHTHKIKIGKSLKLVDSDQGRLVMKAKKAAAYPASSVCFYYFYY